MEVIEAMNTCNEVCIKEKNDQPSIQNTNKQKKNNSQVYLTWTIAVFGHLEGSTRTPQLKVSILSEYKDFQEGLI